MFSRALIEATRSTNGTKCDDCGSECVDNCIQCGAPQCCPRCCDETTAAMVAECTTTSV